MVFDKYKVGLKAGDKVSAWVIPYCGKEPKFVEGVIKEEEEGSWCEGDLRLHTPDDHYYIVWFKTAKEAIEYEIEMAQHRIDFEKEMQTATVQELEEEKQYWVKILGEMK